MPTFLANPIGLWALLAIPAILVIHMLREKARMVRVSTLFLVEPLPPRTPRGRALHFIQNSIPLWLQLLAALLCTWLLVEPRWISARSLQSVALILDNSASMSAARERVQAELPRLLQEVAGRAARTEWAVTTSDSSAEVLYRGTEVRGVLDALTRWKPLLPQHDPTPAFATALAQARGEGTIYFISDEKPVALPAGVQLMAFGRPVENRGFAGVRTWREKDGAQWEAIVKNSGSTAQTREWWFEAGANRTRPQPLQLAAGQIRTIGGPFPGNEKHLKVMLTEDAFALDDELALVAPEPKRLAVSTQGVPPDFAKLLEKVLGTLPAIDLVGSTAGPDVAMLYATDLAGVPPEQAAIAFAEKGAEPSASGAVFAEGHTLMEGIVWEGLLSQGALPFAIGAKDQVLLWQGERPLIVLQRTPGGARRLVFCFEVASSNADRLPAFVLLITRFLESVRVEKVAHAAENFETGQTLGLPAAGTYQLVQEKAGGADSKSGLAAPREPGFFKVSLGGKEVLDGAAHFGDPREGDFSQATSDLPDAGRATAIRQVNSVPDPLETLWLLLLAAALLGSWAAHARSVMEAVTAT